jgi:asparagine synthase (glutamine-hydrolysing)
VQLVCGISGSTNDPDGTIAATMSAALRHRGPDDDGIHLDARHGVTLAARRLSIIDVSGGHQPLDNEDGDVWAVCNGEIYNYERLIVMLEHAGHRFRSRCDTEVLVHLYEEFGEDMVHALEGMYSFAIWDETRGRLLIVRDRFGEKPLFYAASGGDLHFASELSALVAAGKLSRELVPSAVDAFFVFGYVPGPETIFEDGRQLPPGHLLAWDHGSREHEVRSYWAPPRLGGAPEPPGELAAEAERLLEASMRSRLVADVPVGVLLSGGVDSTLVAAMGARVAGADLKTFTVGYDVGDVGETHKARQTAKRLRTTHYELELRAEAAAEMLPRLCASLDQPVADQALLPLHAVCGFARERVKVVVGGEGADELFGGYPRYRWLTRAAELERAGALPPRLAGAVTSLPLGRRGQLAARLLSEPDTIERRVDWVTARRRHHRAAFYGPRLGPGDDASLLSVCAARMSADTADSMAGALMHFDQVQWLPDDVLAKADRASMLVGIELRTPYLERELSEFAMSIRPESHLRRGGKAVLRTMLADQLGGRVQRRPKTAFRVPSADWIRGPVGPLVDEQIQDGTAYRDGWLDRDGVGRLLDEHRRGAADHSDILWPVLTFGLWYDQLCAGS